MKRVPWPYAVLMPSIGLGLGSLLAMAGCDDLFGGPEVAPALVLHASPRRVDPSDTVTMIGAEAINVSEDEPLCLALSVQLGAIVPDPALASAGGGTCAAPRCLWMPMAQAGLRRAYAIYQPPSEAPRDIALGDLFEGACPPGPDTRRIASAFLTLQIADSPPPPRPDLAAAPDLAPAMSDLAAMSDAGNGGSR